MLSGKEGGVLEERKMLHVVTGLQPNAKTKYVNVLKFVLKFLDLLLSTVNLSDALPYFHEE